MSEPLTDAELAAIREREEQATKGPWDRIDETGADVSNGQRYCAPGDDMPIAYCYGSNSGNNIRFIAHARTDIPKMLAEIDRLKNCLLGADEFKREMLREHEREREQWKFTMDEQRRIDQNELRKALAEIDRLHQNLTLLP